MLTIDRLEMRLLRMPLRSPFETSFGVTTDKSFLLLRVFSTDGAVGVGECVAEDHPYYLPETNGTVAHVIRDFLAPLLLGAPLSAPADVVERLSRIRGHEMAKAAVEMAVWSLFAGASNKPLWSILGGREVETIGAGVSIGLQPSIGDLIKRVAAEVDAGYQRIKIKIKPGSDLDLARAVRREFPKVRLMVDANSAYRLADADHLCAFDDLELMMIEQPLAWNDVVEHVSLQRRLKTPICLDESVTGPELARDAISIGACKIINIKAGRVGGLENSRRIQESCLAKGVPVWCGGMLESGIGRLANVHLQTLPGFTLPGDTSASRRYFDEDLVEPEVTVNQAGEILVPRGPGLGHEIVWSRVEKATQHREVWSR